MSDRSDAVDLADEFVGRLHQLDRADLARLKRCAGRPFEECTDVFPLFYRLLPAPVRGREWEESDYFLVATLLPLAPAARGDLGAGMRRMRAAKQGSEDALDRRMTILLDCSHEELTFRLRQTIRLLASAEVGVNWAELLRDIRQWDRHWKPTQKKWARSYFGGPPPEQAEANQDAPETVSEEAE